MREIQVSAITDAVRDLCIKANTVINGETVGACRDALSREISPIGADILHQMIENSEIDREKGIPVCQDTGMVVLFIDIGQDAHIIGGDLNESLHEGVRRGYGEGCFRASNLDPLTRRNFGDKIPAVIHMEMFLGDRIKLSVLPKGFGGEMRSQARLFHPSAGMEAVKAFIVDRVARSGALISESIKKSEIIAYEDLGTEAIRRLTVESFPAFVAVDAHGGDLYEREVMKYRWTI